MTRNGPGRWLRHLWHEGRHARSAFPAAALDAIEARIGEGETRHSAELRFVVEAGLDLPQLARGVTARKRAEQLFGQLGVWDTEHDNGVLIYVLLADHAVEIVVDRAAARVVPDQEWRDICDAMARAFAQQRWLEGALLGIDRLNDLLAPLFPAGDANPDELPNRPSLI